MATIKFDGEGVAHATSDSNTTTESSGAMVQAKRLGDVYGSTLDTRYEEKLKDSLFAFTNNNVTAGAATEAGGVLNIAVTSDGAGGGIAWRGRLTTNKISDDIALDVSCEIDNFPTGGNGRGGLTVWEDTNNWMRIIRLKDGATQDIEFQYATAGSSINVGVFTTTATNFKLRITRTAVHLWEGFYDVGSGWVSLGTQSLDFGAAMQVGLFYGPEGAQNLNMDVLDWTQTEGDLYWDTQTVEYSNKTFLSQDVDFSNMHAIVQGVVEFDYSTDGGSSYTGTFRTLSAMQALAPISSVTQLRLKARFNGGGETALASVSGIRILEQVRSFSVQATSGVI